MPPAPKVLEAKHISNPDFAPFWGRGAMSNYNIEAPVRTLPFFCSTRHRSAGSSWLCTHARTAVYYTIPRSRLMLCRTTGGACYGTPPSVHAMSHCRRCMLCYTAFGACYVTLPSVHAMLHCLRCMLCHITIGACYGTPPSVHAMAHYRQGRRIAISPQ